MPAAQQEMSTIDASRLARHFLKRLCHEAEQAAIDRAFELEILELQFRETSGPGFGTFVPGVAAKGKSATEIRRILGGRRPLVGQEEERVFGFANADVLVDAIVGDIRRSTDHDVAASDAGAGGLQGKNSETVHDQPNCIAAATLLQMARASAQSLRAPDVATLLLVAQGIQNSQISLGQTLSVLSDARPIITVLCEVPGFEESFLELLKRGLILPGKISISDGYDIHGRRGMQFTNVPEAKWQVLCFPGKQHVSGNLNAKIGEAAQTVFPILGLSERPDRLPPRLVAAAQLNLQCGLLNAEIVGQTVEAVLGTAPNTSLHEDDYPLLDLADLALAIRPGIAPARAMTVLRCLAEERRKAITDGTDEDDDAVGKSANGKNRSLNQSSRNGTHGSGSRIIQPVKPTGDEDRFILRVETLSGYGEELPDWAMSLQDDLSLWRAGVLEWDQMRTKLLLSGPPGTGKTRFAEALCNSLGIPLVATSVSTWLEPSYLGDVLKRMSKAFGEAQEHSPCILFIDEIDGIGSRGRSRHHDDYWTAVVNRGLELLDGAIRFSGVIIVGATNNPDIVDKALLRAGRLETHIEIGKPDTSALVGIIRHHLKNDLDAVVASAPERAIRGLQRAWEPEGAAPEPAAGKRKPRDGSVRPSRQGPGFTSGGNPA